MTKDLCNMLLQATGRTGKSQYRLSNPRWNRGSGFVALTVSTPTQTPRRATKLPPQVPLKTRHQPEKGGKRASGCSGDGDEDDRRRSSGEDSDSAASVGSDLYKDEEDKEKLEKMSELDRQNRRGFPENR